MVIILLLVHEHFGNQYCPIVRGSYPLLSAAALLCNSVETPYPLPLPLALPATTGTRKTSQTQASMWTHTHANLIQGRHSQYVG